MVFLDFINKVFHDCLDKFIVVFIDDIFMYSKSHEEHEKYLRFTLQTLWEKQLYANFLKCEFWLDKVLFLGHVVLVEGIEQKIKNRLHF